MLMVLDCFTNVFFKLKFTRITGKMAYCISKSGCINNFCQSVKHLIAISPQINLVNIPSDLQFVRSKREAVRQCCFALRLLTKRAQNIWVSY